MGDIIGLIQEMFSYTFLARAFIVGLLASLCASLLGVSLVLKRYSMIGDGLSHVGFGALAVAAATQTSPLAVSIPVVVIAAFALLRISENSRIKGDAAIALISAGSLAVGVMILSMTTGMNTDVCNYMFGSILAMSRGDVRLGVALSLMVLVMYAVFYNKIFAVTFDENFARATGVRVGAYNMMLAMLSAITIVLGMRLMGAMLISSLVIFPALSSMRLFGRFRPVVISSAVISVACFCAGIVVSYKFETPTGASVVCANIAVFCAAHAGAAMWNKTARRRAAGAALIAALAVLLGASPAPAQDADILEIKEKMFVAQTNDIYLNLGEYAGRRIKLEGMFTAAEDEIPPFYYVYRFGPGCCSADGTAGFEIVWPDGGGSGYPNENDWVEAAGTLEVYKLEGFEFPRIVLESLIVKAERGKERVEQ